MSVVRFSFLFNFLTILLNLIYYMKKFVLTLACVASMSAVYASSSVTATPATQIVQSAEAADLNEYAGKYKFEGLPFEFITVSVKDGKLMINTGTDEGELTPVKDATDKYDAGGQATLTFVRDANKKVSGLTLEAQGFSFEGKKEQQ